MGTVCINVHWLSLVQFKQLYISEILEKAKTNRLFKLSGVKSMNQLHYDVEKDVAFCNMCTRADHESKFPFGSKWDLALLSKGYNL